MTKGEVTTTNEAVSVMLSDDAHRFIGKLSPSIGKMLTEVAERLPTVQKTIDVFGRRQSQYMDAAMTCSHPTPIRNLRQVASEIDRAKSALREAWFAIRKRDAEAKVKDAEASELFGDGVNQIKAELLRIEAEELRSHNDATMHGIGGAIRKIRALQDQHESLLKRIGKDELTEADFEADEARYHVMKAFEQALCAARSRGGTIDEGNHIYFCQIGINGGAAQAEINAWLQMEKSAPQGKFIGQQTYHDWLERMADNYAGEAAARIKMRGLSAGVNTAALLIEGEGHE